MTGYMITCVNSIWSGDNFMRLVLHRQEECWIKRVSILNMSTKSLPPNVYTDLSSARTGCAMNKTSLTVTSYATQYTDIYLFNGELSNLKFETRK